MKGIIYYYSSTGNTELACEAIVKGVSSVEFRLCDITKEKKDDPEPYDIVGFAAFTDFWGPPQLLKSFIESLPKQNSKAAFIFNTYAALSGSVLLNLGDLVRTRGFKLIAGHSLHMPQNYPPQIASGMRSANSPNQNELSRFHTFISVLDKIVREIQNNHEVKDIKLRVGFLNGIIPSAPRTKSREMMGEKFIDNALCTQCGQCVKDCPYNAIVMKDFPVFDTEKCYGCWSCYNHCPAKAIYTKKLRGKGHYNQPLEELRKKLLDY